MVVLPEAEGTSARTIGPKAGLTLVEYALRKTFDLFSI
jgi:hypothetical protein